MSDQEITYSTLSFQNTSSELKNRVKLNETQGQGEAKDKDCSVPWRLIAVALGVLCSLLLVAVAVLVVQNLHQIQEKHQIKEDFKSLKQECCIMKEQMDSKEEMLKNKSKEYDNLKNFTEEKICYLKNKIHLNLLQHAGEPLRGHWFCYGIKCYYVILDNKTWDQCKNTCQSFSLSFLKLNDVEEQKFLQFQLSSEYYWIGLFSDNEKWQWIDNGTPGLNLHLMKSLSGGGKCAFFSSTRIENDDCNKAHPCICEKRMDHSPIHRETR